MAKNLIIKTTMDNSDFDKKYSELTRQLNQAQKEQELLNNQTKNYKTELEDVTRKYNDMSDKAESTFQRIRELQAKGASDMGMSGSEYRELDEITKQYEKMNPKLDALEKKQRDLTNQVEKQALKEQRVADKIENINGKLSQTQKKTSSISVKGISKDLSAVIKKTARWALAIFGIRTAYMAIRSAISYLTQYNEEMARKIESIKYTIAMALSPVIEKIVDLVYKLVQYIGYLLNAWFKIDIFAKKANKSISSAVKATKSLAGFDKATVLSSGSGGGSSGASLMTGLGEGQVPEWLKWIQEHGSEIGIILASVATALTLIRLGVSAIKALGIGIMLDGIINLVKNLIKYIEDPSWNNFGDVISRLGELILGLGLVTGNLALTIIGACLTIDGYVVKNWNKIKNFIQENIINWITSKTNNIVNWLEKKFGFVGSIFGTMLKGMSTVLQEAINGYIKKIDTLLTGFKQVFDGILKIFKGDFAPGFASIGKGMVNLVISALNTLINNVNKVIIPLRTVIVALGKVLGKDYTFDNVKIPTIPKLAVGGIVNNPGKGVPVGGAIAGEAGREGVLPLTDAQAMSELGKEIGKWISVNVDLTTKLDSRVLSRSLEKVQQSETFMRNGV